MCILHLKYISICISRIQVLGGPLWPRATVLESAAALRGQGHVLQAERTAGQGGMPKAPNKGALSLVPALLSTFSLLS